MSKILFNEFDKVTSAAWKQKIQVDLKGADYNSTLLWHTDEDIVVKPFYTKEDYSTNEIQVPEGSFNVCQTLFIDEVNIANTLALDALNRGADAIQFLANKQFDYKKVLDNINLNSTKIFFKFSFLDDNFLNEIHKHYPSKNLFFQTDIIGNLAETGNWFKNLKSDFSKLKKCISNLDNCISVSADLYQNSGATIVQQLAYALAHANEYLNSFDKTIAKKIHFTFSVGSNYFFEISKLHAFRILWASLLKEYEITNEIEAHIFVKPSLRNKTIYDYNVNMLRTTSECMSAILGGANTISNLSYDTVYGKSNEFGERISRNQLLVLKEESGFAKGQNFAKGAYYIETITHQLAEKALILFKKIEKGGGFLKQLKEEKIQKKITEAAAKEQKKFNQNEIVLLGTNFQQDETEKAKQNIELYPFVKQRNIKTLITPIIKKRLSETIERERLNTE